MLPKSGILTPAANQKRQTNPDVKIGILDRGRTVCCSEVLGVPICFSGVTSPFLSSLLRSQDDECTVTMPVYFSIYDVWIPFLLGEKSHIPFAVILYTNW